MNACFNLRACDGWTQHRVDHLFHIVRHCGPEGRASTRMANRRPPRPVPWPRPPPRAEGVRAVFFPSLASKPRVSGHMRKVASRVHLD